MQSGRAGAFENTPDTDPDLPGNRWHRVTSRHLADHLTLHEGAMA